jgi:hypothetical protein
MWGTLLKVLVAAVLEWARQLISDRRAADAERELGRKEQAEVNTKEVANANAEQAAKADENGAIAGRPLDRVRNRDRLRDGSA